MFPSCILSATPHEESSNLKMFENGARVSHCLAFLRRGFREPHGYASIPQGPTCWSCGLTRCVRLDKMSNARLLAHEQKFRNGVGMQDSWHMKKQIFCRHSVRGTTGT